MAFLNMNIIKAINK